MNPLATALPAPRRKLVAIFAHRAPLNQHRAALRTRKQVTDAGRMTALNMLETGRGTRGVSASFLLSCVAASVADELSLREQARDRQDRHDARGKIPTDGRRAAHRRTVCRALR